MAPAMKKSMKVKKASGSKKPTIKAAGSTIKARTNIMKKPSSSLTKKNLRTLDLDPVSVTLSLDKKIAEFEKKPADINGWLARLSKQEREACWKRFEYDRKSVPGAQEGYLQAACGKRSKEVKLDLLKAFLANNCSCKGQAMQQAFMSHGITVGSKSKESWRPFVYMSQYYGVSELFRRVQNGSIAARKNNDEWEFKLVQTTSYRDEHDNGGFKATASGKLSEEKFQELQGLSSHNLAMETTGNIDKGLIDFLQSKASAPKSLGAPSPKPAATMDADVIAADKLSDLGTIGRKAKERLSSAVSLLEKVIAETDDDDTKLLLGSHLKGLKKEGSGTVSREVIKDKLIKAMQCVKKAKHMSSASS
jgi:hypothetical protein